MAVNVYEKAALYYAKGWWGVDQLAALAGKGLLTDAQVAEIVGADLVDEGSPEPAGSFDFSGMTAAEVVRSLSYRPTKDELQQACDWLGIAYDGTETNAELRALIDAAAEAEAE